MQMNSRSSALSNEELTAKPENVQFYIGEVVTRKDSPGDKLLICGYDRACRASDSWMKQQNVGQAVADQPFYHCLMDVAGKDTVTVASTLAEGSNLFVDYVPQSDLVVVSAAAGMQSRQLPSDPLADSGSWPASSSNLILHPALDQYFSSFNAIDGTYTANEGLQALYPYDTVLRKPLLDAILERHSRQLMAAGAPSALATLQWQAQPQRQGTGASVSALPTAGTISCSLLVSNLLKQQALVLHMHRQRTTMHNALAAAAAAIRSFSNSDSHMDDRDTNHSNLSPSARHRLDHLGHSDTLSEFQREERRLSASHAGPPSPSPSSSSNFASFSSDSSHSFSDSVASLSAARDQYDLDDNSYLLAWSAAAEGSRREMVSAPAPSSSPLSPSPASSPPAAPDNGERPTLAQVAGRPPSKATSAAGAAAKALRTKPSNPGTRLRPRAHPR